MNVLWLAANGLACLLTAGVGVLCVLAGAHVVSLDSLTPFLSTAAGRFFLFFGGSLFLLIAARFAEQAVRVQRNTSLFAQDGEWGRIALTPRAIREFITGILQTEIGLTRFSVSLRHSDGGLAVVIRATLTPDQQVSAVGREIQERLVQQVENRTGVAVRDVELHVRSIRPTESTPVPTETEEPVDE